MHVHPYRVSAVLDNHPGGGVRRLRQFIGSQRRSRNCGERRVDLCCGADRMPCAFEMVIGAVDPGLYLWLKQVHRAGDCQHYNERDTEQAGIEVPAPDGAIIWPWFADRALHRIRHG